MKSPKPTKARETAEMTNDLRQNKTENNCHSEVLFLPDFNTTASLVTDEPVIIDDRVMVQTQRKVLGRQHKNALAEALPFREHRFRKTNTNELRLLQKSLGILPESPYFLGDPVFISIDFKYSPYNPKTRFIRLREVGISSLDTRNRDKSISSQHYRTVTDTKEFVFGQSIDATQEEITDLLRRLLFPENKDRKLILVGQGINHQTRVLKGLGLNLALASSVEYIFDTYLLAVEVFNQDCDLSRLLTKLGIQGTHSRNAGNDASFILRAMLLLAIYEAKKEDNPHQRRLKEYGEAARKKVRTIPCSLQYTPLVKHTKECLSNFSFSGNAIQSLAVNTAFKFSNKSSTDSASLSAPSSEIKSSLNQMTNKDRWLEQIYTQRRDLGSTVAITLFCLIVMTKYWEMLGHR